MPPTLPASAPSAPSLTSTELDVAKQLVTGASNKEGSAAIGVTPKTFSSRLGRIGRKFHAVTRPARAHAVLCSGQVLPPAAPHPAPSFDGGELRLLRALAELANTSQIARATGLPKSSVRPQAKVLVRKAGAENETQLIGWSHGWNLLGANDPVTGRKGNDSGTATRTGPAVLTERSADRIRCGFLNLRNDGGPDVAPGVWPSLWHDTYDLLDALHFDWLGLGELTHSQTRPNANPQAKKAADLRWEEAQRKTGMRGFRAAMGQGRNPVGLLVREATFTLTADPQHHLNKVFRTPPAVVELGLRDVPKARILSACLHASYCNPHVREAEAYETTSLVDKVKAHHAGHGPVAVWLFGDFNELPVSSPGDVPDIDWNSAAVTDVVHRRHRARKLPDGTWSSFNTFDEILLDVGMHDPARFAARRLGKPAALATGTAGLAPSAFGQGGPCRIDRAGLDAWSVQAVTDVQVVPMGGETDHDLLIVDISRRKFAEGLRRAFPPLDPWELMR